MASDPLSLPGPSTTKPKPTHTLPKGKACLECRKRKVRCDAQSPCAGCIRMRKECVYEEEWERILRLQGTVDQLEQKLKQLQMSKANGPDRKGKARSPSADSSSSPSSSTLPSSDFTFSPRVEEIDLSGDWWRYETPPQQIQKHLIDIFFDTARAGFLVDKPRFYNSLRLPAKAQPHPALLNVLYLIACHHSDDPHLKPLQDHFLMRARAQLQISLRKRDRLIHFLMASALLAYYFLKSGRFLEASYQISTAARFAIACGLHKITSPVWKPPSTVKQMSVGCSLQGGIISGPIIPPPRDATDLGERINVFWMLVIIDHSTSLITGLPSNIDYEEIDTVWPRAIDDYASGAANHDKESVKSLFDPDLQMNSPGSPAAMTELSLLRQTQCKAIVLLERVVKFTSWARTLEPETLRSPDFLAAFERFFHAIERHLTNTPPLKIVPINAASPNSSSPTPSSLASPSGDSIGLFPRSSHSPSIHSTSNAAVHIPKFALVHTYCLISYIHLYSSVCRGDEEEQIPGAYDKRLEVAKRALSDIRAMAAAGTDFRKHLMMQGFAWGVVARVFAEHVKKLSKILPEDDPRVSEAKQDLAEVVNPIRLLCQVFPILEFQLERLRVYEVPIPGG